MERIRIFILVVISMSFIYLPSCLSTKVVKNSFSELDWKKEWVDKYLYQNRIYQKHVLTSCPARDVSFDIERKIRAINHYPVGIVVNSAKEYLKSEQIKLDSVIFRLMTTPYNEEASSLESATSLFIVKGNYEDILFSVKVDINKFDAIKRLSKDEIGNDYLLDKLPGCGYGFISHTVFNKRWDWEIESIIINPDVTK